MEIPENATSGTLFSYAKEFRDEKIIPFVIEARERETIYIKWESSCFYSISVNGDYMSKYNSLAGVITKRKNGKWMFKGHQRLYSNQEVKFY